MRPQTHTRSSFGDVITGTAAWIVAGGILTMALFPMAIPGLVLAAAVVPLLLLIAIVVALLGMLAVVPAIALRGLRRRSRRHTPKFTVDCEVPA
jgi:hypothetical protein